MGIVETEGVLGGEPRLEGRRISVLQIADRVVKHGWAPEDVAYQLDIPLAEVHLALEYYREYPHQMNEIRDRHRELETELEEVATRPPGTAEQ